MCEHIRQLLLLQLQVGSDRMRGARDHQGTPRVCALPLHSPFRLTNEGGLPQEGDGLLASTLNTTDSDGLVEILTEEHNFTTGQVWGQL